MVRPALILMACCCVLSAERAEDDTLRANLQALIAPFGKEVIVEVALLDLESGTTCLIRADEPIHPASTMKVPVMLEVYRQASTGNSTLDDTLKIKNSFASIVNDSKFTLDPKDDSELTLYQKIGEDMTIRELVRLMITESSNLATNLLVEKVSAASTTAFMKDLGADGLKVLRGVEDGKAFAKGLNNVGSGPGADDRPGTDRRGHGGGPVGLGRDAGRAPSPEVRRGDSGRTAQRSVGGAQDGLDQGRLPRRGDHRDPRPEAPHPGRDDARIRRRADRPQARGRHCEILVRACHPTLIRRSQAAAANRINGAGLGSCEASFVTDPSSGRLQSAFRGSSRPESQCMMFRAIWRLSRPGTFIPNFSSPMSWADISAASPRITTRPFPKPSAIPWARPAAGTVLPSSSKELSTAVSASLRIITLAAGPFIDVPVKVWILLTRSDSSRPRVIG